MLLNLLALELQEMVQGVKYDVTFPESAVQSYTFTPRYGNLPVYFEISNVAIGSKFDVKICTTAVCYQVWHTQLGVSKPLVFLFNGFTVDQTYILQFQRIAADSSAKVLFEQYEAVQDHTSVQIQLINGRMQFLYVNCLNDNTPATLKVEGSALLYLSTGSGYVDSTNCTQNCGLSEVAISDFRFIRGIVVSEAETATLRISQSQFKSVAFNGAAQKMALPKSRICAGFYTMKIQGVYDQEEVRQGITSVAVMAYHELPAADGDITVDVSPFEDFRDVKTSAEGQVQYTRDDLAAMPQEHMLFIRVNQIKYLAPSDLFENTEIMISGAPNIVFGAVRDQLKYQLAPFYRNATLADKMAGTRYFQYSFLRNEINTEIKLNGVLQQYQAFYVVKMTTDLTSNDYADGNLFIDYDSIANSTNNVPITTQIKENGIYSCFAFQKVNASKGSDENFAFGQSLFTTGSVQKQQADVEINSVETIFEADSVVQLKLNQTVYQKYQDGVSRYYYQIPRETAAAAQGGAVLIVQVKYCSKGSNTFRIYSSSVNPLPSEQQHERFYGKFTDKTIIGIPYSSLLDAQYDYIAVVKDYDTCAVSIASYYYGDNLEILPEGTAATKTLADQQTSQFVIAIDGFSYSKQTGWLKLQILGDNPTKYKLDFGISEQEVFASDASSQNYIYTGSVYGDYSMHYHDFQLKGLKRFYVTINRTTLDSTLMETPLDVFIQAGAYVRMDEQYRLTVPIPKTEYPTLLQYRIRTLDNIYFEFDYPESVVLHSCTSVIPTVSELDEICQLIPQNEHGQYYLAVADKIFSAGTGYITVQHKSPATREAVQLTAYFSSQIAAGSVADFKTNGYPYYFTTNLPRQTEANDLVVAELHSCENCVICLSSTAFAPNYNISHPEASDCDVVIGRLRADDLAYGPEDDSRKTYPATYSYNVPSGLKQLYGQVISLGALGIAERVRFSVTLQQAAKSGETILANIGYTQRIAETVDGLTFYPEVHYRIAVDRETLLQSKTTSLTVAPQLNDKQTLDKYDTHHFSIYASTKHLIPTFGKYEWAMDKERGVAVISLNESEVQSILSNQCAETAICYFYVTIFAARDSLPVYSTIEIFMATYDDKKPSSVVSAADFGKVNNLGQLSENQRQIYHFNVVAQPMTFVVSSCVGNPQLRAGKTDFFRRSQTHDSEIEESEHVYYNSSLDAGGDIYFQIKQNSAYEGESDWFFELQSSIQRVGAITSADFIIGNSDPRPGTPIRSIDVGTKKKRFQVMFHPAVSSNENHSQQNLEYNIFLMANAQSANATYNPNTACGFMLGGIPLLANWQHFGQFASKQYLESDVDYTEFVALAETKEFYISVLARQVDTQIVRSYNSQLINMNSLPGSLKYSKPLSEWAKFGIAAACVVLLIILGVLMYVWWKKHQASHAVLARE